MSESNKIHETLVCPPPRVKCIVWDLDNTLWDGILSEDKEVYIKQKAVDVIMTLDRRGILHSIASRNDYDAAFRKLESFGLADYFLFPQINWNPKSGSIREIARLLNLSTDALAFIDDEAFERAEVKHIIPGLLCIDAADIETIPEMQEINPTILTEDSANRRKMYLADQVRCSHEEQFNGAKEEFLKTLNMRLSIMRCTEEHLKRAEELTVRTHQMNTTGITYSYDQLKELCYSDSHLLLIAGLDDKFGTYGKVGLALIQIGSMQWTIKLFLMSCRIGSRGIGGVFLDYIIKEAQTRGVKLSAEYFETGKNRMMHIMYKFAGFKLVNSQGDKRIFEMGTLHVRPFPDYIQLVTA